jgi:hypothetical protein
MNDRAVQKREINLGDEFGDVAVTVNGRRVEFRSDGSLVVETTGAVAFLPANDAVSRKERAPPRVGEKMPDGSIYAGISPDTGKPLFAAPADAPLAMKWRAATKYTAGFEACGHRDWRLPTIGELDVLYRNRCTGALKGTFKDGGVFVSGLYWSSSEYRTCAGSAGGGWMERFTNGHKGWGWKSNGASVRPVRG